MKQKAFSILAFFLTSTAIAEVNITAELNNNQLELGLSSNDGQIYQNEYGHHQFFIDSDNNSQTGYIDGSITGADYMIEDDTLFVSRGSSFDDWEELGTTGYDKSGIPNTLSASVDTATVGVSSGSTIRVGVNALDSDWNEVISYHGTSMLSFTLGSSNNNTNVTPELQGPFAVFNQAYQEANYDENDVPDSLADSITDILNLASNAYVLLDPFDIGNDDPIAPQVAAIQSKNNQVSGYISVGTGENWRDDFSQLEPFLSDKEWEDWQGEFFVNVTTTGILDIMKARIDKIAAWGLDWVEFDNMDWASERTTYNLDVTLQEAEDYVRALCDYTHQKGMKCMAKSTLDGFSDLFDGVTYESYHPESAADLTAPDSDNINWWDENDTKNFLSTGKPVVIVHYNEADKAGCDTIYNYYKDFYSTANATQPPNVSFICEVEPTATSPGHYLHYNNTQKGSLAPILPLLLNDE